MQFSTLAAGGKRLEPQKGKNSFPTQPICSGKVIGEKVTGTS